jgi:Ca2+-binding EF-hand superfamily protein
MKEHIMRSSILIFSSIFLLMILLVHDTNAIHNLFSEMDVNHDGKVSLDEFSSNMAKSAFDSLDKNKDGFITPEEWSGEDVLDEKEKAPEIFRAIDKQARKRFTYPDFSNYAQKYSNIEEAFMVMDKNKDGILSPDEVTVRPLFRLFTIRY